MNNECTIKELAEKVGEFCDIRDWAQFHDPKNLAMAMSVECNELMEIFRYKSDSEVKAIMSDEKKRTEVCDELGDVFFVLLRFIQMHGINLDEALLNKMKKTRQKYPEDISKGKNIKYYEY